MNAVDPDDVRVELDRHLEVAAYVARGDAAAIREAVISTYARPEEVGLVVLAEAQALRDGRTRLRLRAGPDVVLHEIGADGATLRRERVPLASAISFAAEFGGAEVIEKLATLRPAHAVMWRTEGFTGPKWQFCVFCPLEVA